MRQLTLVEWIRRNKIGEENESCRDCQNECGSEDCFDCNLAGDVCPVMGEEILREYKIRKAEELRKLRVIQKARLKP